MGKLFGKLFNFDKDIGSSRAECLCPICIKECKSPEEALEHAKIPIVKQIFPRYIDY